MKSWGTKTLLAALLLPALTGSWWWICRRRNPRSCIAGSQRRHRHDISRRADDFAERAKEIAEACTGYLYYVSLKGVTGAAITDHESIKETIESMRQLTDLPVVVGFGIKDTKSARAMASVSDGIIIGSALVEQIAKLSGGAPEKPELPNCCAVIGEARGAIDSL